jgi:hypothetical protein
LELGYRLRDVLINKWHKLGYENSIDDKDLVYKVFDTERIVNTVIGKNIVPAYPFFLIIILQSIDSGNNQKLVESSYGYYYDFLITHHLSRINIKNNEIDALNNYIVELANYYYERDVKELTYNDIYEFNIWYCQEYDVQVDLDKQKTEGKVYKFKLKDVEQEAKRIAKIFKLNGELKFENGMDSYIINIADSNRSKIFFSYEKNSGMWSYQDSSPSNFEGIITNDEQAISIAKKFLSDNLFLNQRFDNIKVSPVSSGDTATNNYKITEKQIYFCPTLDGVPILGTSRIIVTIGANGKITGVDKYYKDIEEYKTMKIKSAKEAFEKVKTKEASININQNAKSAKVTKVKLGYWEDAGTIKEQPYLQPVWIFTGEAVTDKNEKEAFDAVVPALE